MVNQQVAEQGLKLQKHSLGQCRRQGCLGGHGLQGGDGCRGNRPSAAVCAERAMQRSLGSLEKDAGFISQRAAAFGAGGPVRREAQFLQK